MTLFKQLTTFPIYIMSQFFFLIVKNNLINQEIQQGGVEFQFLGYYTFFWKTTFLLLQLGKPALCWPQDWRSFLNAIVSEQWLNGSSLRKGSVPLLSYYLLTDVFLWLFCKQILVRLKFLLNIHTIWVSYQYHC